MDEGNEQYRIAVAEYQWVKENIKYRMSYWGDVTRTLAKREGHCGIKAELLVARLKEHGIKARYVEGRPLESDLPLLKLPPLQAHFWVEARVDGYWLTLDPTPDPGIAHLSGDTIPGSRLGTPQYITRWDEIPVWFKEFYNHRMLAPLRFLSNLNLDYHRRRGK